MRRTRRTRTDSPWAEMAACDTARGRHSTFSDRDHKRRRVEVREWTLTSKFGDT